MQFGSCSYSNIKLTRERERFSLCSKNSGLFWFRFPLLGDWSNKTSTIFSTNQIQTKHQSCFPALPKLSKDSKYEWGLSNKMVSLSPNKLV